MKIFCKHDYEIIKDYRMKNQTEILVDKGVISGRGGVPFLYESKYIIIYKCKKCGKVKESVFIN